MGVAACSTPQLPTVTGAGTSESLALQRGQDLLADARAEGSISKYEDAIIALRSAADGKSTKYSGSFALGQAFLEKARLTSSPADFTDAAASFEVAAGASGDPKEQAVARMSRGDALLGRAELLGGSGDASKSLEEASKDYQSGLAVATLDPSYAARGHFALARAYEALGNTAGAAAERSAGVSLGAGLTRSDDLLELASAQAEADAARLSAASAGGSTLSAQSAGGSLDPMSGPESSDEVLKTLRRAAAPDADPLPIAHARLGERLYLREARKSGAKNYAAARAELQAAAATSGSAKAEGLYYLSIISRDSGDLRAAIQQANQASDAGAGAIRYKSWECLLRLQSGRPAGLEAAVADAAFATQLSNSCLAYQNLAEGRLLSGLSLVRRAQYFAPERRVALMLDARKEFEQGKSLAVSAPSLPHYRYLSWPGLAPVLSKATQDRQRAVKPNPNGILIEDFLAVADGVVVEQCVNTAAPAKLPELKTRGLTRGDVGEVLAQYKLASCYNE